MAGIIYTAAPRAPFVTDTSPPHSAGNSYSIDVKMSGFIESIETPKTVHVSLGAKVETVLKRASKDITAVFLWPHELNNDMEEFLFSIAGGESFQLDPYGTIAVPDSVLDVVCVNNKFIIGRMTHGNEPWRTVSLTLRPSV